MFPRSRHSLVHPLPSQTLQRKRSFLSPIWVAIAASFLLLTAIHRLEAKTGRSQGADLVFGGQGTLPGEFTILRDLTFNPQGQLYTLEAGGTIKAGRTSEYTGIARVQKFSRNGDFISQFPLGDDLPADKTGQPMRLAVDSKGNVFVTFPLLDFVRQYGPDGKKIRDHALPAATSVALDVVNGKERIAAIAGMKIQIPRKGWQEIGGDEILLLDPEGGEPQHIALPQKLGDVQHMTVDKNGHFYVIAAAKNSIYIFDDAGKPLKTIGAENSKVTRNPDGSEPLYSVSVDSKGNVYSLTWSNPGLILKYTVDGRQVLQRAGQFQFGDVWFNGNYAPMAIAPDDRLWIAAVVFQDPLGLNFSRYHFRPTVMRLDPNFLDPNLRQVKKHSTLMLGLTPKLESKTPYNVTHEFAPIEADFVLPAANRNVSQMDVAYHIYDLSKSTIGEGNARLALENGVEARVPITFTPTRYGWYVVEVQMKVGGEDLGGVSEMFGVTPQYANMPVKIDEFWKGWNDAPRQMFCGLNNVRLSVPLAKLDDPKTMEGFEKDVSAAQKYGTTWSIQLTDKKDDFTPEKIRPLIERFKGRVARYELFNEPNFSIKPDEFVTLAAPVYKMIKEIDPQAQVMGPSVCGIQLPWYKGFYEAGGARVCDILTIHDYEGNESISPEHWRWKFKELHKLMAQYGDEKKAIWQTERCVSGLRTIGLLPGAQAVRVTLHLDLLQTLGVPPEHNNLYYLNEGGYVSVPSYVWCGAGPHPAALALRTREALTKDRKYMGAVDFGSSGADMLMGLRYDGARGPLVIIRNLGTLDMPLVVNVSGGDKLETSDAFGNTKTIPVKDGKASLTITQLPSYLLLKPGDDVVFPKFDFGRNIATSAKIAYAGKSESDTSVLQNGILETVHAGGPHGDTSGSLLWRGEILKPGAPQNLDLQWTTPRTFDTVFLHGVRADNIYCALLDYDLQAWQNGNWKTISEVRTPLPPTDPVAVIGAKGMTWLQDNNFWVNHFAPVTSDRLRIVFRRATFGLAPDEISLDGRTIPSVPMLREIEVFAPIGEVSIAAQMEQPDKTAAFDHDTATIKVTNKSRQPVKAIVQARAPEGWNITPSQAPVSIAPGSNQTLSFVLNPPAELPIGRITADFSLEDAAGKVIDTDTLLLNISAPMLLVPRPPGAFDKEANAQSLGVMTRNLSGKTLSGTIKVEFTGPRVIPPVELDYGPVAPEAVFHANILVPGLNIEEGAWVAKYSAKVNGITVSSTQNLALRAWSVIGPFKNRLETEAAGPETEIAQKRVDLSKNYTDTFGGEQKWSVVSDDAKGGVDLFRVYKDEDSAACYAATWITSPKARRVLLTSAFNRGGTIWVNGKPVITHVVAAALAWGQEQTLVDLQAGANLVLVKIVKDNGQLCGFLFDLLDPDSHKKLTDVTYSPKPEP